MHKIPRLLIRGLFAILIFNFPKWVVATPEQPEMADQLMASGKIYIVVLVLLVILGGIFWSLLRLEKKIGKLEREFEKEK